MKRLLIFLIPLLVLTSCHTNKQAQTLPPAPIVLNNSDSVRVETIIKTEYVPVRVEVPVPQQSVSNIVFETDTSHIETDIAESNAWIRPDGTLYHDIINKNVKLSGEAYVPQTTTENNSAVGGGDVGVEEHHVLVAVGEGYGAVVALGEAVVLVE